ncbi:hypothetical protein CsatB_007288 [Cannabis sativa]
MQSSSLVLFFWFFQLYRCKKTPTTVITGELFLVIFCASKSVQIKTFVDAKKVSAKVTALLWQRLKKG